VNDLAFLSPASCAPETLASPLRRALHGVGTEVVPDLSLRGIVELRGDVSSVEAGEGEELVRLSPRRSVLLTGEATAATERLRAQGVLAYDLTGAYAAFAVRGEQVLRRLTDPTSSGCLRPALSRASLRS
jgi:hypothetical protein